MSTVVVFSFSKPRLETWQKRTQKYGKSHELDVIFPEFLHEYKKKSYSCLDVSQEICMKTFLDQREKIEKYTYIVLN